MKRYLIAIALATVAGLSGCASTSASTGNSVAASPASTMCSSEFAAACR